MKSKPKEEEKLQDFFQKQILGLDVLYEKRLFMPFLTLLYSTIDIVSFIGAGGDDKLAGKRFRDFLNKYVVKYLSEVNAFDIWGARCSILHTGTPESTSSKQGKAREILYCWGKAPIEILHKIIKKAPEPQKYVAMSIEDLLVAFGEGVDDFLGDLQKDSGLHKNCMERVNKFYAYVPYSSS
jgi:hypothetical protein